MNRDRLNEVIEYLKANPETHEQGTWTNLNNSGRVKQEDETTINCGTTGCLAGHGSFRYAPPYTIFYYETLQVPNRILMEYDVYGMEVYDLTEFEACYLFGAYTTVEEMEKFVNDSEFYNDIKDEHRRDCICL